jgi:methylenetetrahydrofolate reductase (NADPH)
MDRELISPVLHPDVRVSLEFFPPSTAAIEQRMWQTIDRMAPLTPHFISVTQSSKTKERTAEVVQQIRQRSISPVIPHLTAIGETHDSLNETLDHYWHQQFRHLLVLRGDPLSPLDPPGAFPHALDLIKAVRKRHPFHLTVAAYPEPHPEALSPEADLQVLVDKFHAGADRAITQFFFDNQVFYRFRDRLHLKGVDAPLIPGILPITDFNKTRAFAERCGAHIPPFYFRLFEGLESDPQTRQMVAAQLVLNQVQDLVAHGVREFHIYTLNRSELTYAICHALGLRRQQKTA